MSQWGRLLLDEIEGCGVEEREAGMWSLGGASFAVKTRASALHRPFLRRLPRKWLRMVAVPLDPRDVRMATAVLSTHERTDRCHRDTVVSVIEKQARSSSAHQPQPSSPG